MDLEKDYEILYKQWLQEFEDEELTKLSDELFSKFKNNNEILSNFDLNEEDKIKSEIIEAYKGNFEFLFDDFMKIREIKIVNSALALQEIKINNLIEPERLFYQNLISAIKGFKKVKASLIYDSSSIIEEKVLKKVQHKDLEPKENIYREISETVLNYIAKDDPKKYNYILVRFLKKTPALVGIDLFNYGPFDKENIAYLPYENAKILLYEKFAEEISIA
jgi:DNA replication initiation complex subunit (GINS family)